MTRPFRPTHANRLSFESLESRVTLSMSPWDLEASLCLPERGGKHELDAGGKAAGAAKAVYTYSVVGNPNNAPNVPETLPPASAGLALVGGGTDVDAVFTWMGTKASGGDFVVLRAAGTNAYNSYIDGLVPSLDSVATLVIPTITAANDPFVADKIRNAEAIFIAGGDQANYVNFWTNTGLESALYAALQRNVPIGGTSAGLAILGEIDFSATAIAGTIDSKDALANPYDSRITLDTTFVTPSEVSGTSLSLLDNVITDSHFQQRDRMGRLVTFLARMDADNQVPGAPRGIAVNEQTALLVEASGMARVVGNAYSRKLTEAAQQRSVFFAQGILTAPSIVAENGGLTYAAQIQRANYNPNIPKTQPQPNDTFYLNTWTLATPVLGSVYTVSAEAGVLGGSLYG